MKPPIKMVAQCFEEGGLFFPPGRWFSLSLAGEELRPKIRIYADGVVLDDCIGRVRRFSSERLAQVTVAAQANKKEYWDSRFPPQWKVV